MYKNLFWLLLPLAACGPEPMYRPMDASLILPVEGAVTVFNFDPWVDAIDDVPLTLEVTTLADLFFDPAKVRSELLGEGLLEPATPNCQPGVTATCGYRIESVELASTVTPVLVVKDGRQIAERWATTFSFMGPIELFEDGRESETEIKGGVGFVISTSFRDLCLGLVSGIDVEQVIQTGFILGITLDENRQPLMGASVTTAHEELVDIYYIDGGFLSASPSPGSTAAHGLFLALPKDGAIPLFTGFSAVAGENSRDMVMGTIEDSIGFLPLVLLPPAAETQAQ